MKESETIPALSVTEADVLRYVSNCNASFISDGALYWNGVRRAAANRLVKKGMLERRVYPRSEGYAAIRGTP